MWSLCISHYFILMLILLPVMHSNINFLGHFAQDFTDRNQGGSISLTLCGFEMLRSSNCIWLYRCSEFHLVLERKRSLLASVFYEKLETWRTHCFLMCLEASFDFPSVTNNDDFTTALIIPMAGYRGWSNQKRIVCFE